MSDPGFRLHKFIRSLFFFQYTLTKYELINSFVVSKTLKVVNNNMLTDWFHIECWTYTVI